MKNINEIRCNPLDIRYKSVKEQQFPLQTANLILANLNNTHITKIEEKFQGVVQSLASVIAFLRDHENGRYLTLPHIVEMAHRTCRNTINVLATNTNYPGAKMLENIFKYTPEVNLIALENTLIASLQKLKSPYIYYLLSGDDFLEERTSTNDRLSHICEIINTKVNHELFDLLKELYSFSNVPIQFKSSIKINEAEIDDTTNQNIINISINIKKDIDRIIKDYKAIFDADVEKERQSEMDIIKEITSSKYEKELYYFPTGVSNYNNMTPFEIKFEKPLYVKEFLKKILSKRNKGNIFIDKISVEYLDERIETKGLSKYINKKISKIKGIGGLNEASYNIELEEDEHIM